MFFKILRRMITGDVLHVSEVPVSNGAVTFRLKLKRERGTGDLYVTLSMTSSGHGNYQYLGLAQFDELVAAVRDTQGALENARGAAIGRFPVDSWRP